MSDDIAARWKALTGTPEFRRSQVRARTRGRYILIVGFPVAMLCILFGYYFQIAPMVISPIAFLLAMVTGWCVGNHRAAKKLAEMKD